jgi:hypothetical protein
VGIWGGHGRTLTVTNDGSATVIYRAYKSCSDDPTPPCDQTQGNTIIPGGKVTMRITAVDSTPARKVAAAHVVTSNDPQYRGDLAFVLVRDVIASPFGSFCGESAPAGTCGA